MQIPLAPVLALMLFAPVLAGCVAPAAEVGELATPPTLPEGRSAVVIAVIDTGVNFYHEQFRFAETDLAPSADDGPADALAALTPDLAGVALPERVPIALSLDGDDWAKAEEADHDRLMEMEPRTLYTFPGTKILGAISFNDRAQNWPLILDRPGGHGTMTASRAVGTDIAIGGQEADVWLVMVQGFTPEALRWVADQDWIDIASISAGLSFLPIAPGVANAGEAVGLSDAIGAYNELSHKKPFFTSTGNGVGNAGILGFPSWLRGASGTPDVLSVGANNNGEMSHWHNQDPYISADGCRNPSADSDDTKSIRNYGGGTSSATPFSAGGGAKLLLEARRILSDSHVGPRVDADLTPEPGAWSSGRAQDATVVLARGEAGLVSDGPLADGVFTLTEFKQLMYLTALPVPTEDESDGDACMPASAGGFPGGENLPPEARFPLHGYGEVNHASIDAAIAVLEGTASMPVRGVDDEQYHMARERKMLVVGDSEA